ncbi:MAG: hypothetical protein WD473_11725 [Acidimicrobiia bacterium]
MENDTIPRAGESPSRLARSVAILLDPSRRNGMIIVALALGVVVLHLGVPGLIPSGADGGNWLALAKRGLGTDAMSAETSYPPLFLALLGALLLLLDPILALTASALIAKTALVVGVYWCTRTLGYGYATVTAAVVAVAGAQVEAYAWGGYPQLLATGIGLLAVFFLVRYLEDETRLHLWLGITGSILASSTHLLIGGLLPFVLLLAAIHRLYLADADRTEWIDGLKKALLVALPGLLLFLVFWWMSARLGVEPVVNPISLDRFAGLRSIVRDAPIPWLLITLTAVGAALWPHWPGAKGRTVSVGTSWAAAGLGFFLITGEPRSLLLTQVGIALLAVVVIEAMFNRLRSRARSHDSMTSHRMAYRGMLILLISILSAIAAGGLSAYVNATNWYRVVDTPEINALRSLEMASEPGDLVIASKGHHGSPVGWWVEGYAERPTYTGVSVDFVAFEEERDQAEIANEVFSGQLSDSQIRSKLEAIGADFLLLDRRGPDAPWLRGSFAQSLTVLYDSATLVIFRVPETG